MATEIVNDATFDVRYVCPRGHVYDAPPESHTCPECGATEVLLTLQCEDCGELFDSEDDLRGGLCLKCREVADREAYIVASRPEGA